MFLKRFNGESQRRPALRTLRELSVPVENSYFAAMLAMNATDALGERAAPLGDIIAALPDAGAWAPPRGKGDTKNLQTRILHKVGRGKVEEKGKPKRARRQ